MRPAGHSREGRVVLKLNDLPKSPAKNPREIDVNKNQSLCGASSQASVCKPQRQAAARIRSVLEDQTKLLIECENDSAYKCPGRSVSFVV
jgi:hypothetical protein